MQPKKGFFVSFKMRFIVSVTASNFLVILIVLLDGVDLARVIEVFWFQSFILFLLTIARILSAEYVEGPPRPGAPKSVLAAKAISLFIFVTLNGLLLLAWGAGLWANADDAPLPALVFVAKCSILFIVNQLILFRRERLNGFHKKLMDDNDVGMWSYRLLIVFVPAILFLATKHNDNIDYTDEQFLLVLVLIAIVDSATQIMRAEDHEKWMRAQRTVGYQPT